MRKYNQVRYAKYGHDTLTTRLYRKYPDLPRACQAKGCDESRVLEAAHKPKYKRNGAYRLMARYKRHMFWMLCPTCHKLIDVGICTPEELGLS